MIAHIYPCLWFNNQAQEAANFYCSVFDGGKILSDGGVAVTFEIAGSTFMGLNGGPSFTINPSISFFLFCKNTNEVIEKWQKLSENGSILMPLDSYPWSEKYGWCSDKYGINWQIMVASDNTPTPTIVPAMMFTQKNAGKAEEAIHSYTSIFSNSSISDLNRYQEGEGDTPGLIKHGRFLLNDKLFIALESSHPHGFTFNEGISFVIPCDTQEEIDYFWQKLTDSGSEGQCGWLKDKYGVSWQVVPTMLSELMSDRIKAPKVIEAFMKMKKFDIATLQAAAQD